MIENTCFLQRKPSIAQRAHTTLLVESRVKLVIATRRAELYGAVDGRVDESCGLFWIRTGIICVRQVLSLFAQKAPLSVQSYAMFAASNCACCEFSWMQSFFVCLID